MLLVDIGNSRLKWRLVRPEGVTTGVFSHQEQSLESAPCWAALMPAETVWLASVASVERLQALTAFLQEQRQVLVFRARAEPMQAGLHNGYRAYEQLGVDRWLAMLAAWRECRSRCLVIDAGTALTVDLISAQGQHEGGHIVPGLQMQQQSLLKSTAQVRFAAGPGAFQTGPGRDTGAAVRNGVQAMLIGYLRHLVQEAWASSADAPILFVTGGDAESLATALNLPANIRPHLVLDGLGLYAHEHPV